MLPRMWVCLDLAAQLRYNLDQLHENREHGIETPTCTEMDMLTNRIEDCAAHEALAWTSDDGWKDGLR